MDKLDEQVYLTNFCSFRCVGFVLNCLVLFFKGTPLTILVFSLVFNIICSYEFPMINSTVPSFLFFFNFGLSLYIGVLFY